MSFSKFRDQWGAWVFTILVAGNLFFIKKVLDKVESTEAITWSLRQEIVVLQLKVTNLENRLKTQMGE